MRAALLVLALVASSPAHADARKITAPTTLLEVRWHSGQTRVVSKVFSTGMWTRQITQYNSSSTTGGRFDSITFDELKTALANARWKVTKAKVHCPAVSDESMELYVAGRKRYTSTTCGDSVDDKSSKLIELLGAQIELTQPEEIDEEIDKIESVP